jgi:exodeoxyribonuclease V alpha subunit
LETLQGTVNRVIFRDPDGYAVLEVSVDGRLLPVTVVGRLIGVEVGERLAAEGQWTTHPRFGRQFKVAQFTALAPTSHEGLLRYLGSGSISGIGPALAARLVERFGAELFEVAEREPRRLIEVDGIGAKRARTIATALAEQRAVREVMVFLQSLGLGPGLSARICRAWGDQSIARVKADPYRLVWEVDGIGFTTADGIAERLGVARDAPSRISAGLLHLTGSATEAGDTVCRREDLLASAATFLGAEAPAVEAALEELLGRDLLAQRRVEDLGEAELVVGPSQLVLAEESIARRLGAMLSGPPQPVAQEHLRDLEEALTGEQRDAVRLALQGPVTVITGGPGTGKTTVLRAVVAAAGSRGEAVHLCAPTGRAAKRLAEATGHPASTIHRLLGFGGGRFEFDHNNRLPPGTVIVDEVSMVDVVLMRYLLQALGDQSTLVLVGDQDQLPSVGPGNVLADLIATRALPVVRLTTVFRQAASSRIVANAHRIREGLLPEPSPSGARGGGEFHFARAEDPQRAQHLVLQICRERIPQAFGLDSVGEVQVLSPMHRGEVGTVALNALLQQQLNPRGRGLKRGRDELRVGDKVMQVRNDYERDVFNGDIGRVVSVDDEQGSAMVEINGVTVVYDTAQLEQLALAYCVSIHKSQGSEYPAVVVPLVTQHYVLLQRNLLYTAVTRARRLVVLVGSERALRLAVDRIDQARRRTLLAGELQRRTGCDG